MRCRLARFGSGLLIFALAVFAQVAGIEACEAPFPFLEDQPSLPRTYGDIRNGRQVLIAAIGGASTLGGAAGDDPKLAWPERMAVALSQQFPTASVRAVNLGVARQTAQDMLRRIDSDVLRLNPTLVIWETGTTDAVRGIGLEEFRESVQAGIDRLKARHVEVMLMDMQYSRRALALYAFAEYQNTLNELAEFNGIPIFHRHDAMRAWSEAGAFDFDVADPAKRRAVAAGLYDCIGRGVASLIARGIKSKVTPVNPVPAAQP